MSLKVYKASAGSGKTYQLALEYICLALETANPSAFTHILAVTFTNKATGEMKDRILAYLYDLAHERRERDFMDTVCGRLHISDDEAARRATATLGAIIHDYDHFRVETIDSFLQSLLTSLAYELRLTRGFSVDLDVDKAVSRAVDRLLLSVGKKGKGRKNISHAVQELIEQNLNESKGWGIAKALKSFSKKNLFNDDYLRSEEELSHFLQDNESFNAFIEEIEKMRQKYESMLAGAAAEFESFFERNESLEGLNKTYANTMRKFVRELSAGKYETRPAACIEKVADSPAEGLVKKYRDNADALGIVGEMAEKTKLLLQIHRQAARVLNTIRLTKENIFSLRLLSEVSNEVTAINNETSTFILSRTPDIFKKMVRDEDSSFVFERAGVTFHHVMIDEFQDTSLMQWDIFKRLLLENLAQGEENMIVGDIKQSIYRWRGGDWKILHNVCREMGKLGEVTEHNLDTNFRSKKTVVDFNNEFFESSAKTLDQLNKLKKLDGSALVSSIYKEVSQKTKPHDSEGGYVRVALYGKQTRDEDILEDLHDQIERLHDSGVEYGDMIILVRKNKEATQIIKHLTMSHPDEIGHFTSDEAFCLSASPAVMLLVSVLKYLDSQEDDTVALELCRMMAEKLEEACGETVPKDISPLIAQRDALLKMPLFELCQRLIRFFHIPMCEAHGAGQSAYIYSFLDHVLAFLEDNASDIGDFIEYWDESLSGKTISADVAGAVRIMTIHKSKGLQRNTVLIPFCDWKLDSDQQENFLWCDTTQMPAPFNAIPLVPIKCHAPTRVKESFYANPYNVEHLNQRIDSINELYVAFTRAEENLLIWSNPNANGGDNSVNCLIERFATTNMPKGEEEHTYELGSLGVSGKREGGKSDKVKGKKEAVKDLMKLAADISGTMPPLTLSERAPGEVFRQSNEARRFVGGLNEENTEENKKEDNNDYISRGNLLHYIFSLIQTTDDKDYALEQARGRGLFSTNAEEEEMARLVSKRLSDPQAREWFDGSWRIFSECTILRHDEQGSLTQHRPDRVMTRDNETIVIDYKTGKYLKKYDKQVGDYMKALCAMGHTNVRGYLWMLSDGQVREVPCVDGNDKKA